MSTRGRRAIDASTDRQPAPATDDVASSTTTTDFVVTEAGTGTEGRAAATGRRLS